MNYVTRMFSCDSAHRVMGHEGACKFLHGHRYSIEVTAQAENLDGLQRVVDFSVIKESVGEWIRLNWDHNTLLNSKDELMPYRIAFGREPYVFADQNPTAEVMAKEVFYIAIHLLEDYPIKVVCVRVWETPNCSAIYSEEGYVHC